MGPKRKIEGKHLVIVKINKWTLNYIRQPYKCALESLNSGQIGREHSGNRKPFIRLNQMNTNTFVSKDKQSMPFRFLPLVTQT